MRKNFTMSDEQLETLLKACEPVSMIMLHIRNPPSLQENANNAWKSLGKELGFNHMTVIPGATQKEFSACTS